MLTLLAAEGTRLDAGSVGLALSRRWSDAGDRVLFVDADASGSRLAERFGEAVRAEYSPAVRGLPSLIVAREPLTLKLLADHCYSLDASAGLLWALFAPYHPAGAQYAARWLGEHADDLRAVDRERSVDRVRLVAQRCGQPRASAAGGAGGGCAGCGGVRRRGQGAVVAVPRCRADGLRPSASAAHSGGLVAVGRRRDPRRVGAAGGWSAAGARRRQDPAPAGRAPRAGLRCGARQDHRPHLGAHGPRNRRERARGRRRDGCWRGGCGRDGRGGWVGGAARFGPFRRQRRRQCAAVPARRSGELFEPSEGRV